MVNLSFFGSNSFIYAGLADFFALIIMFYHMYLKYMQTFNLSYVNDLETP